MSDKTVLITGASGGLGKQLCHEYSKRDIKPIAHVRETSNTAFVDSLGLEKRYADLRNESELQKLVEGVDYVIHTAAWVNFRKDKLTQFTGINTFGAINMFKAAVAAGVERFVQVSTVGALGAYKREGHIKDILPKQRVDEQQEFNLQHLKIPYIMTKHAADVELAKLAPESNTELVTVMPSIMVAPSRTGDDRAKALKTFDRWFIPVFPNWVNLVDIRDVAKGVIAALERGRAGERYILAGDNITARDLMLNMSAILFQAPLVVQPPRILLDITARLCATGARVLGKSKISYYPDLVKLLDYDWAYSVLKAREELGFRPRALQQTLNDLLTNNFQDSFMKPNGRGGR